MCAPLYVSNEEAGAQIQKMMHCYSVFMLKD